MSAGSKRSRKEFEGSKDKDSVDELMIGLRRDQETVLYELDKP